MMETIIVLSALVVFLIAGICIDIIIQYKNESNYIKMEMARSCSKREKDYWRRELKKLRMRYIPLLHLFDKKEKKH